MDQRPAKLRNAPIHAATSHFSQNVKIPDTIFTNHYTKQVITIVDAAMSYFWILLNWLTVVQRMLRVRC